MDCGLDLQESNTPWPTASAFRLFNVGGSPILPCIPSNAKQNEVLLRGFGWQSAIWPVLSYGNQVGKVTSAIYSPRLEKNIALALVGIDYAGLGTALTLKKFNEMRGCKVVEIPFFDPKKSLASAS